MMSKIVTPAGLKKYQTELAELKNVKRRELAVRIQEAKEQGDISENAEYAAAKEELAFVEGRIEEIEQILKSAKIVEAGKGGQEVSIGSVVKVKINGDEVEYEIVGSNEADPAEGKISNESAVGQALLGKKAGDQVEVDTPGGAVEYNIVSVG